VTDGAVVVVVVVVVVVGAEADGIDDELQAGTTRSATTSNPDHAHVHVDV
jgi:hypothetical protein